MLTIFTLTHNESLLMQFMIDHYRSRFPGCYIVIYDNNSSDNTVEIAINNGCEVRTYNTNNKLDDGLHVQIKNTCWKNAITDWVLVQDLDELLDINEQSLKYEESLGSTIINSECWHMINMEDNYNIHNIKYGYYDTAFNYNKLLLFNKKYIKDMNYTPGCHSCFPKGNIVYSKQYKLYHYKYINADLEVIKCQRTAQRLSDANKRNNWGYQCLRSEEEIRIDFQNKRNLAKKVLD
jgi:glycosyltransferase involved in cell wall biosynthesis